tara:strand:+ start:473 stop:1144 length:672 start_codon:yes stop_codon:yes gene_type:complete
MEKIFIICNQKYEKERYENMKKQLDKGKFDKNIEYFCNVWKTDINNYKYDNIIFENINKAEISVFRNHIEILKKIKNNYNSGIFLILESDAYVFPGMKFTLDKINKIINIDESWDIINIGGSCQQIFREHGYPKSKPIIFDNSKFYKENRLICIEALLWKYDGIIKFLNEYEKLKKKFNYKISLPIDCILDNLVESNKLDLFWIHPCLVKQGSNCIWKSNIRE